eukprot:12898387-Prorocentrum_lima.AAC.1
MMIRSLGEHDDMFTTTAHERAHLEPGKKQGRSHQGEEFLRLVASIMSLVKDTEKMIGTQSNERTAMTEERGS